MVNPAVRGDNEFVRFARQKNKIVTSQMNIFFELCPAKIIGITGANGKVQTFQSQAGIFHCPFHGIAGTIGIGEFDGSAAVKFDTAMPSKSMIAASFNERFQADFVFRAASHEASEANR